MRACAAGAHTNGKRRGVIVRSAQELTTRSRFTHAVPNDVSVGSQGVFAQQPKPLCANANKPLFFDRWKPKEQ